MIWTDVAQMAIIWFGIFLCLGVAVAQLPAGFGLRDALALAQTTGHLKIMDLSPHPRRAYTLWSGLVGGPVPVLAYFGSDQSQVQRYLSGRSLTAEPAVPAVQRLPQGADAVPHPAHRRAGLRLLPLPRAAAALERRGADAPRTRGAADGDRARSRERFGAGPRGAARCGRGLRAATAGGGRRGRATWRRTASWRRPGQAVVRRIETIDGGARYNDTNYIFPSYIVTHLPQGLAGLVIAVIFAAAMSTLSGELNSLATASMVDFYQRFVRTEASDAHYLRVSRLATAFWGLFASVVALQAGRLGSAIEVVNRFGSYFYGSILGVFGLAVLTPKASAAGGFLRALRRHDRRGPRRELHDRALPLVQRRRCADGLRRGPRDLGSYAATHFVLSGHCGRQTPSSSRPLSILSARILWPAGFRWGSRLLSQYLILTGYWNSGRTMPSDS